MREKKTDVYGNNWRTFYKYFIENLCEGRMGTVLDL